MTERDPHGTDAHAPGAKLDDGKVQANLLGDFSLALTEVARVCTYGAVKYSRGGWQHVPDAVHRYDGAAWRHMLKARFEAHDADSGLLHRAHEAWNKLAAFELLLRELRSCPTGRHPGAADAAPQQAARGDSSAGKPVGPPTDNRWQSPDFDRWRP